MFEGRCEVKTKRIGLKRTGEGRRIRRKNKTNTIEVKGKTKRRNHGDTRAGKGEGRKVIRLERIVEGQEGMSAVALSSVTVYILCTLKVCMSRSPQNSATDQIKDIVTSMFSQANTKGLGFDVYCTFSSSL